MENQGTTQPNTASPTYEAPKKPSNPSSSPAPKSAPKERPAIALVCDWLTTPGGAEKVLLELHRMYPKAPIYTSQYRPKKIDWFKDADVRTGWLNKFPARLRKILGPLRQRYFSHLNLSEYDLVISVTGAEAKSVQTTTTPYKSASKTGEYEVGLPPQPHTVHLCYCHVPTQYYWQLYDQYVENPGFGAMNGIVRFFFKLFAKPLQRADFEAAQRPDQFISISEYSARQIETYYNRDSVIIAPPVDVTKFSTIYPPFTPDLSTEEKKKSTKKGKFSTSFPQVFHKKPADAAPNSETPTAASDPTTATSAPAPSQASPRLLPLETYNWLRNHPSYYIIASRQVTWKNVDLAVSACSEVGVPLLVVGDGPEHEYLVQLAAGSDLIHFLPWQSSENLATLLQGAVGFIFPSLEPFGLAPVEALAAGCPVLAFSVGGSQDFIKPGKNGIFFTEQTVSSLIRALRDFPDQKFDRSVVRQSAEEFSSARFRAQIEQLVADNSIYLKSSQTIISSGDVETKNTDILHREITLRFHRASHKDKGATNQPTPPSSSQTPPPSSETPSAPTETPPSAGNQNA